MTDATRQKRIVILGGYGVFGGKLAEALLRQPEFEVVIAGRSLESAQKFCADHAGTPAILDRSAPGFTDALAALAPFITVDAAGPFQAYRGTPYTVAEAALRAGSHYLDLSDDAAFTSGIETLQEKALRTERTVLSGVSSVPALSSAAIEELRGDFSRLDLVESAILPGNRAPRGLSVMRAILAQTGRPLTVFRDGVRSRLPGWSGLSRRRIGPPDRAGLPPRWTSFIGAPDLALFPERYGARTVLFRAGLELPVMHLGLWGLSWLPRLRLLRSLEPFARPLRKLADWLEPFGSDRGGMEVRLAGLDRKGKPLSRRWTLIAEAGDGPHIPAVAAAILCRRLAQGRVSHGARPCLGEVTLEEIAEATSHLNVTTRIDAEDLSCLFQQALGPDFDTLPAPVRDLHTVFDRRCWTGEARVTRGTSLLGNLMCRIIGFPPQADRTPVSVTIERCGHTEIWQRNFGGKLFRSTLSLRDREQHGHILERFGPLKFAINLVSSDAQLAFPVGRGTFLGVPLPGWLVPISLAREYEEAGRFHFDVRISMPGLGTLVRYQGWLVPGPPVQPTDT